MIIHPAPILKRCIFVKRRGPGALVKKPAKDGQDIKDMFALAYRGPTGTGTKSLIEIIIRVGELVADIVGVKASNAAFAELVKELGFEVSINDEEDGWWRYTMRTEILKETDTWPMGRRLRDLNTFAQFGVIPEGSKPATREQFIRAEIKAVDDFLTSIPFDLWNLKDEGEIRRILAIAKGRLALDCGSPIDVATLALLGDVSEKHIRNLMAGSNREIKPKNGAIPAEEAKAWLRKRLGAYKPSRWQGNNTPNLAVSPEEMEAAIFVPVAEDGTAFLPDSALDAALGGVFAVGSGHPRTYTDYYDALDDLQRLREPVWRAVSLEADLVEIAGVRWERRSRSDIERLAKSLRQIEDPK